MQQFTTFWDLFPSKSTSNIKVLDTGCGYGETLNIFNKSGYNIQGIDISQKCVDFSQQFGTTICMPIEQLSKTYPQGHFDITICSHTLEHIENPTIAIKNISYVTSNYIILAVPNLARLVNFFLRNVRNVNEGHKHGWDHHHFLTFIEKNFDLQLHNWIQDIVTFPFIRNKFLYSKFISEIIERKILSLIFPMQCNSVIAIFKKN